MQFKAIFFTSCDLNPSIIARPVIRDGIFAELAMISLLERASDSLDAQAQAKGLLTCATRLHPLLLGFERKDCARLERMRFFQDDNRNLVKEEELAVFAPSLRQRLEVPIRLGQTRLER